ncbi:MAG TPA: hypothetical protein QF572_09490 [Vicinamibacterales bacterium]|nr:hypothetical protein [Vicinamibacterales bacterium]
MPGVISADGTPVAFPVGAARLALEAGEDVALSGQIWRNVPIELGVA